MSLTLDQFAKMSAASGVLSADEVKEFWSSLSADERPKTGEGLAELMASRGRLTPFQAGELLAGRGGSLILGDYVLEGELGAGGMGKVYQARHRTMNRIVALKVMSAAAMNDETACKRFQREVRAAARLDHPNVVTAYDSGASGNAPYLVMQFVDGGDLSSRVKRDGPLPLERAIDYVAQAAQGLAFAHGAGVIHRDIKPANLLVDKKGVVKILDLGLARIEDTTSSDGLTATEQVMGTVDYMAPEQAADTKHVDARADIYSLGCTLWYLLTGQRMYDGNTMVQRIMKHRDAPLPSLVKARDDVPWSLEQVFHKMVAKRPEDRQASMEEVLAGLEPHRPAQATGATFDSGSQLGGRPADAELSAFFKSVGPGAQKTAMTLVPATVDATVQYAKGNSDTDPKSEVAAPRPLIANNPPSAAAMRPSAGDAAAQTEPRGGPKPLLLGGLAAGIVLIAGAAWLALRGGGEPASTAGVPSTSAASNKPIGPRTPAATAVLLPTPSTSDSPPPSFFQPLKPPPGNYALSFVPYTGTRAFAVPDWNYDGKVPLTIEAWLTTRRSGYHLLFGNNKSGPGINLVQQLDFTLHYYIGDARKANIQSNVGLELNRRTHIAVTFDRSELRMFIDGFEQNDSRLAEYTPSPYPFFVGSAPLNGQPANSIHGVLDEVRISRVVRYKSHFKPAERHEPDADTEALYHFDEGWGETAQDASPHGRHVRLTDPVWVHLDGSPIKLLPSP